jgi:hypothetical protein
MTRDEILNMPAGREIDALIANRVFGMRIDKTFTALVWIPASYSTNIAVAWMVVEKMKIIGHNFRMVQYAYNRTYATFENDLDSDNWIEANGEYCTPLAICRAALLAVMGDDQ